MRDLMFRGFSTFNEFQRAGEGIASNVLTDRLVRLEAAGIIGKRDDPADSRRYRYFLTRKGIDLAPAMVELVLWSARHEETDAPPAVPREMRTRKTQFGVSPHLLGNGG